MTRGRRLLGLVLLAPILAWTGVVGARRIARPIAVTRACEALEAGRFEESLRLSEGLPGADEDGRIAAVCRCRALQRLGREADCDALLDGLLRRPEAAAWLPPADLAARVVRRRGAAGEVEAAAALARRAALANPEDAALHQLEIAWRSRIEGEQAVLEDLERRLAAGEGTRLGARLALALSHARRHDHAGTLAALGETPPPAGHPYVAIWFQTRAWAEAGLGDLEGVRATYAAWRERGGDPVALEADYALQLSIAQLRDPEHDWVTLLRRALEHEAELRDPKVPAALYLRWIGHLLAAERWEEALALYDRASERYELPGLTREQLRNRRLVADLGEAAASASGTLAFRLPAGAAPGTLLVSPDVGAEPDAPFEAFALAHGAPLEIARGIAVTPQRWVFRDADGRAVASGSVWPAVGARAEIEVTPGAAVAPARFSPAPRPGDGRRRVFVILPDCGDWRLVQYLRARGELPVMDALFAHGRRAVLESDPPLTAAAMEKLVWPERGAEVSLLGELNRLGLELAGLASVGRNPLGFLSLALPESRSLFEIVGAGPHVAANLLFSHGGIDAGRSAVRIGPGGVVRPGPTLRAWRELSPREAEEWARATSARAGEHARTIAAEMDAAVEIAAAGEVDFLVLRLESLDLLTHELFGELTGTRQDDGRTGLLDAYRYVDRRIGEVWNALDRDDVLVVLSDHGIRTAMEHARDAVFVAVGGGVVPGRVPGRPEFAGVPRALAALLGIDAPWPETGLTLPGPAAHPELAARDAD